MKSQRGFTLIELLVVIAIISILATIVVPRVSKAIGKARMTKAMTEVNGIDLALTQLLVDANRKNFRQFGEGYDVYDGDAKLTSEFFYKLLRQGRDAEVNLYPAVRGKLGETYMDLGKDPWDNTYLFLMGPWRGWVDVSDPDDWDADEPIKLRSWREGELNSTTELYEPYEWNQAAKTEADKDLPGNPALPKDANRSDGTSYRDDQWGFPAPTDLTVYVWSKGANLLSDQNLDTVDDLEFRGGGDDINNWDKSAGWSRWYTR